MTGLATAPRTDETAVQGVIPLTAREATIQRWMVLALAVFPLAGLLGAFVALWKHGFGPTDLGLLVGFYLLSGFGVTIGYHRLLTHRSFEAPRWLRGIFAVAGSLAVEGGVLSWVADHRRHHAYSDKEGDPHSPHLEDGPLRGLWHAHFGWLLTPERTSPERWAPDLASDPMMRRIDRSFPWLVFATFALPAALGGLLTHSLSGMITGLLWGGLARVFLLNHVTFSINSICHFFGRRPFRTGDESRNNWPLALLSLGESWHNNHHAFPTSAIHGLRRWQLDLSGGVIVLLERLGLARSIKRPTDTQLARRS